LEYFGNAPATSQDGDIVKEIKEIKEKEEQEEEEKVKPKLVKKRPAFTNINFVHGLIPAVSLPKGSTVSVNFGETHFVHDVPEGYHPTHSWLLQLKKK